MRLHSVVMPGSGNISTCLVLLASVLLISLFTSQVLGHGSMLKPPTWLDAGGRVGMKPYHQCSAGSELPVTDVPGQGISCFWFNNFTSIPEEPTLDPSMSSFPQVFGDSTEKYMKGKNPWMSPGSAPLYSPCGAAGGNPYGCPVGASQKMGDYCQQYGYSYGPLAEDYYVSPGFPGVVTTEWKAGAVVEAAWGFKANHGGGYAYRLCKVPKEGMGALTEECFQQGHLEFFGNMQAVQTGENVSSRVEFEAHRTKKGTFPKGSQWTRVPVPNCLYVDEPDLEDDWFDPKCECNKPGHYFGKWSLYDPKCKMGIQFPAPAPGIFGWGGIVEGHSQYSKISQEFIDHQATFNFSIVDQLKVPSHLPPGDYVLSFRWDCEHTSQVWNQCANIKIV